MNKLTKLKTYYGSWDAVAEILGIGKRHLQRVRDGKLEASDTLQQLIDLRIQCLNCIHKYRK